MIYSRARSQLYIFRGASVVIEGAYNFLLFCPVQIIMYVSIFIWGAEIFLGGHCPEMPPPVATGPYTAKNHTSYSLLSNNGNNIVTQS